jgi:hypothetical protein
LLPITVCIPTRLNLSKARLALAAIFVSFAIVSLLPDPQARPIPISAARKEVESNPHVRLYMEIRSASKPVTWELYMGSPNQQMMNGWKIDTYRRGDKVSVDTYRARDGSTIGFAKSITHWTRN